MSDPGYGIRVRHYQRRLILSLSKDEASQLGGASRCYTYARRNARM